MKVSLPEQVWIDVAPASFGSRALAYIVDFLIRWSVAGSIIYVLVIGFLVVTPNLAGHVDASTFWGLGRVALALLFIGIFLVEWSYPIFFEVYRDGVTPGKKMLGLRVVDERGLPISFRSSFLRTALNTVDMMPSFGLVAFVSMAMSKRSQRLGDLVAKTMVIYQEQDVSFDKEDSEDSDSAKTLTMPLELYNIIDRYKARRETLPEDIRLHTLLRIEAAIKRVVPDAPEIGETDLASRELWLADVLKKSKPEKQSEAKSKRDSNIQWGKIRKELLETEHLLKTISQTQGTITKEELTRFAQAYRGVCQRYAYLSTFYPKTPEANKAAQIVRNGRRFVYGKRLDALNRENIGLSERVGNSFAAIRFHCALASSIAILGGVLCALLIQLQPGLSWHFLNEETVAQLRAGHIWTEKIVGMNEIAASRIMTNNISVSITAFVLGITGGVGTVIIMLFNGIHLGGVFASLAIYDMADPLFNFVVAHGFLEISIILVAGGCGLFLGDAILNPGHKSRKHALQENASIVVPLLLFNAACLVLAGLVEGFISPQPQIPFVVKLAIGLVLGSLYWSFLLPGSSISKTMYRKVRALIQDAGAR